MDTYKASFGYGADETLAFLSARSKASLQVKK